MKLTKGLLALALGATLSAGFAVGCSHGCEGSACSVGDTDGGTVTPDPSFPGLSVGIKECSMPGVSLELNPTRIFIGYPKTAGGAETTMRPKSDTPVVAFAGICNAGVDTSAPVNAVLAVTPVAGQTTPAPISIAVPAIEKCSCFAAFGNYPGGFSQGTYQFTITLAGSSEPLVLPTLSQYTFSPTNPGPTS